MGDTFLGYPRENGAVGVRNQVAVMASVFCAATVAQRIAQNVPGTVALVHPLGCGQVGNDLEMTYATLAGVGRNPNFSAVLVVGLGCERITAPELVLGIAESGKRVEALVIQEEGDTLQAIRKGTAIVRDMAQAAGAQRRQECPASALTIGLNCGASDTTSGIAANPALGVASDKLVAQGGSSILTEVTELIGAEHILARRAVDPKVAEDVLAVIGKSEAMLKNRIQTSCSARRNHLITTGNYEGGLSSVVDKALGGMMKSGSAPVAEVFAYGDAPTRKGLLLLDGPGQDGEASTGQVAAGAQIICFPTGRGTPTGFPGVPVIKITGNPRTYSLMKENIDINAGTVITGEQTLREAGETIYQEILAVASGKPTKAEALGHHEQFCIARLP